MANRVEDSDVKEIIDTDLDNLTPFITAANLIVTAKLGDSDLSDDHLKEIERWLSAHFVAIRDPSVIEERIGSTEAKYYGGQIVYSNAGKDIVGLNATPYGQQVLMLDTTGLLAATLGKKIASFEMLA